MLNNHCPNCQNRTKLFLKPKGCKEGYYICKQVLVCPFTNKNNLENREMKNSLTKSKEEINNEN